jgi:hypothetical protein
MRSIDHGDRGSDMSWPNLGLTPSREMSHPAGYVIGSIPCIGVSYVIKLLRLVFPVNESSPGLGQKNIRIDLVPIVM